LEGSNESNQAAEMTSGDVVSSLREVEVVVGVLVRPMGASVGTVLVTIVGVPLGLDAEAGDEDGDKLFTEIVPSTGDGVGGSATPSTHSPRQVNDTQFPIIGVEQLYAKGTCSPGEHGTHVQSMSNCSSPGSIKVELHWQSPSCEAEVKFSSSRESRGQRTSASKVHVSPV
jgi:hypothetical protein